MRRRSTFVRLLVCGWAVLQLASPGLSAIADGKLARENATLPATHVEAKTTTSCPVVHAPDCGVCRYLSLSSSNDAAVPAVDWEETSQCGMATAATTLAHDGAIALPFGRGPPTA